MSKDILMMVIVVMMMTYSALGETTENNSLDDIAIELESESRGLDFTGEIEKQEGQFRVVLNSVNGEGTGDEGEGALKSDTDPLTVTLIKTR